MTNGSRPRTLAILALLTACGSPPLPAELVGVFDVRVEQPGARLVVSVYESGAIREFYAIGDTDEFCVAQGAYLQLDANARLTEFRVSSAPGLGESSGSITRDEASGALRLHFDERSVCPNTCAIDFEPITLDHTWTRIERTPDARTRCLQLQSLWACPNIGQYGQALDCDLPAAP